MRPNTIKNCDFMSILYSKPFRGFKKPTFKTGDRVRLSKYDCLFAKVTSRSLHENFLKLYQMQQENRQHTQSKMSKARLFEVNFTKRAD